MPVNDSVQTFRRLLAVMVCLAPLAWAATPLLADEHTGLAAATAVVERLQTGIANAPGPAYGATFEQRYAALAPLIEETHDLSYIARFALRREWTELSDDQRNQFIDAFVRLSITSYVSRFRNAGADTFAISDQGELPRGQVEVTGTLSAADGKKFPIAYILIKSDDSWTIINIIVDGISDLALKRSEYRQIMKNDGFSGLLEYLSSQIDDLVALYASD